MKSNSSSQQTKQRYIFVCIEYTFNYWFFHMCASKYTWMMKFVVWAFCWHFQLFFCILSLECMMFVYCFVMVEHWMKKISRRLKWQTHVLFVKLLMVTCITMRCRFFFCFFFWIFGCHQVIEMVEMNLTTELNYFCRLAIISEIFHQREGNLRPN